METTIVYWGYIGIMENKMETTITGELFLGSLHLGPFCGQFPQNAKSQNANAHPWSPPLCLLLLPKENMRLHRAGWLKS